MIIKDGMGQELDRSWFAAIRPAVVPTLAFLVTVAAFLPPAMRGIDSHHDGFMLKCAMDVFSGQTIHKDTFTQYGVLSTYLQVGFLWAFGAVPALAENRHGSLLRGDGGIPGRELADVPSAPAPGGLLVALAGAAGFLLVLECVRSFSAGRRCMR